jgi:RNA polymerase sigma-70 factor (ECF subfamily)
MCEISLFLETQQTRDAADLIARARSDVAAFGELYRQHYRRIFRYCRHRLFLHQAAEDVTAEVFMKMVEKFDAFRGDERAFQVWLYRIATNCTNAYLRKRNRRRALAEALAREQRAAHVDDGAGRANAEDPAALKRALLGLPPRQQAVIALRYFEDMKHAEIATIVGGSAATVRSQISRALARLQGMLTEKSDTEHGEA